MKRVILPLALSFFGVLFALFFIECTFRILASSKQKAAPAFDRPRFYFMPKGSNSLQQGPIDRTKASARFRIAVVGDSFTFAPKMQYTDAYPKRLEQFLNLNSQTPTDVTVEVLNFGVPGNSTFNEVQVVKDALAYKPDLVLIQITLNDPQLRPLNQESEEVQRRFGKYVKPEEQLFIIRNWKSLAYVLERLHNQHSIQAYIDYHHDLFNNPETRQRFNDSLRSIKAICDSASVKVGAIIFPLFDFPINAQYPFHDIHQSIGLELSSLKIPFLDLEKAYKKIKPERLQLIPGRDSHPNEIAHRIASEKILEWLARHSLVPYETLPKEIFGRRDNIYEEGTTLRNFNGKGAPSSKGL